MLEEFREVQAGAVASLQRHRLFITPTAATDLQHRGSKEATVSDDYSL